MDSATRAARKSPAPAVMMRRRNMARLSSKKDVSYQDAVRRGAFWPMVAARGSPRPEGRAAIRAGDLPLAGGPKGLLGADRGWGHRNPAGWPVFEQA